MSEARSLGAFVAGWELFADAALSGAAAGALLGCLGVWVVLRRQVFLAAALGQVAALGVAAVFWGRARGWLPPTTGPLWGAAAAVLACGRRLDGQRQRQGQGQVQLGLCYLGAAAAVLALGSHMAEQMHDIQSLLFGSAVAVSPPAARGLYLLCAGVLGLQALMWRGIMQEVIDADGAAVRGLPVAALRALRLLMVGLSIAWVTTVLGALPASAFSVLPAVAALSVAANLGQALMLAALLGGLCGLGGYLLAFLAGLPVGAAQALVAMGWVVLAAGLRRCRRPRRRAGPITPPPCR